MPLLRFLIFGALAIALMPIASTDARAQTDIVEVSTIGLGMGSAGGPFTFYSLRNNHLVTKKDSASADWDLGFRSTTVIVNGGTSGPGEGAIALISVPFDNVSARPADSLFRTDGSAECPNGDTYAICTGSLNGWYEYAGSGVINPIPETTLVVRLAKGGYAKVRILKYEMVGDSRQYTFEFAVL